MSPDRFVVAVVLLSVIGCAPDEISLISTGPLDDLAKIPQDATAFAETGGPPILEVDERRLREFEDYWYGPWERARAGDLYSRGVQFGLQNHFQNSRSLGPTCWKSPPPMLKASRRTRNSGNIPVEPYTGSQSETHRCARFLLPTRSFYDFRKAGEGYPFDYNQNSAVWAGTPLFLSHISQDGRFLAAESPYACGWIDLRDIAYVDEQFVAKYRSANLAAVGRDRIPISSDRTGFLFQGRIGMLLPMATGAETGVHLLAPVADASRRASMTHVRLLDRDAAPFPLPSSEDQLAKVINEILGQPYGWGGLGGYRDCSSTILDVFLPFALPLPRNSRSQASAGRNVTVEQLSLAEKREHILATAVPFRTILNLDGHNMLYLGVFEGSPVAFHTIWGLKTESADESNSGRYLIGKSVITSLSPGRELSELSRCRGDLLSRIRSFTLLGEQ